MGGSIEGTGPVMHIGEVATRTELSLRSLRHWEEVGLLRPSGRTDGGFRLYTEADVDKILVIRRMKPLGFSLEEMADLLDVLHGLGTLDPDDDGPRRAELTDRLRAFHAAADTRVTALRRQLAVAEGFAATLSGHLTTRS